MVESGSYRLTGNGDQYITIADNETRTIISKLFDIDKNLDKYFHIKDLETEILVCMIDLKNKSPINCKRTVIENE